MGLSFNKYEKKIIIMNSSLVVGLFIVIIASAVASALSFVTLSSYMGEMDMDIFDDFYDSIDNIIFFDISSEERAFILSICERYEPYPRIDLYDNVTYAKNCDFDDIKDAIEDEDFDHLSVFLSLSGQDLTKKFLSSYISFVREKSSEEISLSSKMADVNTILFISDALSRRGLIYQDTWYICFNESSADSECIFEMLDTEEKVADSLAGDITFGKGFVSDCKELLQNPVIDGPYRSPSIIEEYENFINTDYLCTRYAGYLEDVYGELKGTDLGRDGNSNREILFYIMTHMGNIETKEHILQLYSELSGS